MRTAPQPPTPPEGENEKLIFEELLAARDENRPVSRHMLSQKLHSMKGLPPKQAFAVVEVYCEDKAPSTPEYLDSEFMVPYLKFSAGASAFIAVAITAYSANEILHGLRQWMWGFAVAGFFLLLSLSGWLKSLWREFRKA